MTHRPIKHMIATVLLTTFWFTPTAFANCNLQATPLTNMNRCREYVGLDKQLNIHYKKLLQTMSSEMKTKLRDIQRDWIIWRDETCDEIQEKSGCNENGSCNGVVHDYCIIDLTRKRNEELQLLLRNPASLKVDALSFSKDYE